MACLDRFAFHMLDELPVQCTNLQCCVIHCKAATEPEQRNCIWNAEGTRFPLYKPRSQPQSNLLLTLVAKTRPRARAALLA